MKGSADNPSAEQPRGRNQNNLYWAPQQFLEKKLKVAKYEKWHRGLPSIWCLIPNNLKPALKIKFFVQQRASNSCSQNKTVAGSFIICFPNNSLVGMTSILILFLGSCNFLGSMSDPRLVSFPWHLSDFHLPEVLTRGIRSTCWVASGTFHALEFT